MIFLTYRLSLFNTDNLVDMVVCTIFGGLTITIPKLTELKEMLNGMMIYQAIDLENKDSSEVLMQYDKGDIDAYLKIREVLRDYTLSSRSNFNA